MSKLNVDIKTKQLNFACIHLETFCVNSRRILTYDYMTLVLPLWGGNSSGQNIWASHRWTEKESGNTA